MSQNVGQIWGDDNPEMGFHFQHPSIGRHSWIFLMETMSKEVVEEAEDTGNSVSGMDHAFRTRLKSVLKDLGEDKSVSASGKSWKSLSRYAAGYEPPFGVVAGLAKAAGVSINWLATGEGPRDSTTDPRHVPGTQSERPEYPMLQVADPATLDANSLVLIPRLDVQAAAGSGSLIDTEQPVGFVAFQEAYLRDLGINPRFAQIIQVKGRSMYPTLDDKEFVVLDISIDRIVDEAIYAVVYGGLVLIKRIRIALDGTVTLSSDNREGSFTDQVVKPSEVEDLRIVGRLKGHFRVL